MLKKYLPGDNEWLYVVLSANWHIIDNVLSNHWTLLVNDLIDNGLIDKAFFVRYFSKTPVLRMRFSLMPNVEWNSIIAMLKQKLNYELTSNQVWDISLQTYKREILRYSEYLISQTEELFHFDSLNISSIISKFHRAKGDSERIIASFILVDYYLDSFGFSSTEKFLFLEDVSSLFKKEFHFDKYNAKQFNVIFRRYKPIILDALSRGSKTLVVVSIKDILKVHHIQFLRVVNSIQQGIATYNLHKDTLVKSYIHMMFNRLFITSNRTYELIISELLARYYKSLSYMND